LLVSTRSQEHGDPGTGDHRNGRVAEWGDIGRKDKAFKAIDRAMDPSARPATMRRSVLPPALDAITGDVVDSAIQVHSKLGPGLLERTYQVCLVRELEKRGRRVRSEVPVGIVYDGIPVDIAYRLDLLVDDQVVVEVKAVEAVAKPHIAQLLTYLKLSHHPVGILLNFNAVPLRNGIHRLIRSGLDR